MTPCPKCGKPSRMSGPAKSPQLCPKCARKVQDELGRRFTPLKALANELGLSEGRAWYHLDRWRRRNGLIACVLALLCLAASPPIPKPSSPRPHRTAPRLALQSPKGMAVFPLAGAIINPPRVVTLAWDYSFTNSGVDSFKAYYWTNMIGTNVQGYGETTWQGAVLTGRVSNLVAKATYWFAVQAGATNGLWSDASNIVTDHPTNLVVTFTYGGPSMQWATSPSGPWKATNSVVNITNATAPRLYFRGVGITNRVAISTMRY